MTGIAARKYFSLLLVLIVPVIGFAEDANTVEPHESIHANGTPLSLSEAVRFTLMNNFDIHVARLQRRVLAEDITIARSIYDTAFTAEGNYTMDEKESTSTIAAKKSNVTNWTAGLEKKTPWGTTFELNLLNTRTSAPSAFSSLNPNYTSATELAITQPLLRNSFGFLDRGSVALVRLNVSKLDLEILDRIEENVAAVEKAYWKLVLAYGNLEARRKAWRAANDFLAVTKDQYNNGAQEDTDLYAAEANELLRQNNVLEAERALADISDDLKLAMNFFPDHNFIPIDTASIRTFNTDYNTNLTRAIEKSRTYTAQKIALEAQELTVALHKNKRWPELDLETSFTANGLAREMIDAVGESGGLDNPTYYVGARFSIPLENRKARGEYKQSEWEKAQALWNLKRTEKEIVIALTKNIRAIQTAQKLALHSSRIEDLQRKKLNGEETKYGYGRSSSDIIIRFQDDALFAELAAIESCINYETALVDVKRTQNILLDEVDWITYEVSE